MKKLLGILVLGLVWWNVSNVSFADIKKPKIQNIGIVFPIIENKNLLFVAITGFGIGWASMMGIPYLIVVSDIPKERYGVYMGIINMMIVIPMIIQTLSFGYILKHFLGNDPRNAITFAAVLLVISAALTLIIKTKNKA